MGKVSVLSIISMFISFTLAVLLPVGMIIFWKVKRRLNARAMLVGSLMFVVFATILERILNAAVMSILKIPPQQTFIFGNPILQMLYGGLVAGIFEESARFLGFKYLLRDKENENLDTGISYGLGHGTTEAIILAGFASVGNIVDSIMINSGTMATILKNMPANEVESANQALNSLINLPSYMFIMGGIERVFVLIIQISLSLLVFKAVVERKRIFFILAIAIHAVINFPAILYQSGVIKNIFLIEFTAFLSAALCAFFISRLYTRRKANTNVN